MDINDCKHLNCQYVTGIAVGESSISVTEWELKRCTDCQQDVLVRKDPEPVKKSNQNS